MSSDGACHSSTFNDAAAIHSLEPIPDLGPQKSKKGNGPSSAARRAPRPDGEE